MDSVFRFICLILLGCSINVVLSIDVITETVSKHGRLSVNGLNLVDQSGQKFQIKGMGLGWSVWWPQYYNADTVKGVHQLCHANAIRAAMAVGTGDRGDYLDDPQGEMRLIEAVIEAAISEDIYVLVDWHEVDSEVHVAEAKDFFDKISKKYGRYPNIIYETFNEPVGQSWSYVLKPYHEAVIKSIRANDPYNVIIVGTPNYSTQLDEAAADPITIDKNVMYTMHWYAATHTQWLRNIAETALNKGIPIFVTEYGVTAADGNEPIDLNESRIWWDWMDSRSMSYLNYDIADKTGEACSALIPGTPANQVCNPAYLTTSGKLAVEQNKK
nr:glycoside hydrolase family 5 subfamily 2 [Leptura aurulenta]